MNTRILVVSFLLFASFKFCRLKACYQISIISKYKFAGSFCDVIFPIRFKRYDFSKLRVV